MAILERQLMDLPLGGGLQSKVDPRLVPPGQMLGLVNGDFSRPGSIGKRPGMTALGTSVVGGGSLTGIVALAAMKDQLLLMDGQHLYAYSSGLGQWASKGTMTPCRVRRLPVSTTSPGATGSTFIRACDVAATADGKYLVYAYTDQSSVYGTIVDVATGAEIVSNATIQAGPNVVRHHTIAVGNTVYVVLPAGGGTNLKVAHFTSGDSGFSAVTTLQTNAGLPVDVAVLGSAVVCAYSSTDPGVRVFTFDTTGVLQASVLVAETVASNHIGIAVSAAGDVYVAYRKNATNDVRCFARTSTLSVSKFAPVTIETLAGTDRFTAVETTTTNTMQWFYDYQDGANNVATRKGLVTSAGAVSGVGTHILGVCVRSKAFKLATPDNSTATVFLAVRYRASRTNLGTPEQSAYFIVDASGNVHAKHLDDFVFDAEGSAGPSTYQWTGNVAVIGTKYIFAGLSAYAQQTFQGTQFSSVVGCETDFANDASCAHVAQVGPNLLIGSGVVWEYDGAQLFEQNFHVFPDDVTLAQAAAGGLADGVYQVCVVYAWVDAVGQLHRSSPSTVAAITIAAGGGTASITITAPYLHLTTRTNVHLLFYATDVNGATFYEQNLDTLNDKTTQTVAKSLTGILTSTRQLYTGDGTLANVAPPPALDVISRGDRAWLFGDDGQIWFSRQRVPGEAVAFAAENTVQPFLDGGRDYRLIDMDGSILVFGENRIQRFTGTGAADNGTNSDVQGPQLIAADSGAQRQTPIVLTADGVLYQSGRGFCLLNRSLQVDYGKGAPADTLASNTYRRAVYVPFRNQARFVSTGNQQAVYDDYTDQWMQWNSGVANYVDAVVVGSNIYYATTANAYVESGFKDGSATNQLLLDTGWMRLANIAGFQRLYTAVFLGEWRSSHTLVVEVYYDYAQASTDVVTLDASSGYSAGDPLHLRVRSGRQCDAVRFRVYDTSASGTAESFRAVSLTLDLGMKKGPYKQGRSVEPP